MKTFSSLILLALFAAASSVLAQPTKDAPSSPYMGAPVELVKAPNGAIANKKLLDRINDFAWLEPTIENPAPGIWVFGGYTVAPISIIETEDGRLV